mmetsp:Transcript_21693/g.64626  ORF Transcript_21693/g.64626 Transcript_21693/m.64626 type:complete len:222 (-) Transcript_21693:2642-3307(-)
MVEKKWNIAWPPVQGMRTPPRSKRTYCTASACMWTATCNGPFSPACTSVKPLQYKLGSALVSLGLEAINTSSKLKVSGLTAWIITLFAGFTVTNSMWIRAGSSGFRTSFSRSARKYRNLLITTQLLTAAEETMKSACSCRRAQKFRNHIGGRLGFRYWSMKDKVVPLSNSRSGCMPSAVRSKNILLPTHVGTVWSGNLSQFLKATASSYAKRNISNSAVRL